MDQQLKLNNGSARDTDCNVDMTNDMRCFALISGGG